MDTQLQLARWNGYRSYSEDLIRLYFGVNEPGSKARPNRNLCAEFEESSTKDARFREKLRRYSEEGTSPRTELPTFPNERTAFSLQPTAPGKRRGVQEIRSGPIELGKFGDGIVDVEAESQIRALAAGLKGSFSRMPVCRACVATGNGGQLVAATWPVATKAIDGLLKAMVAAGAGPLPSDDNLALRDALALPHWTLALVSTVRKTPYGTLPFGRLAVPVRRRSKATDPTLSTGEWNRWIRALGSGRCQEECAGSPQLGSR